MSPTVKSLQTIANDISNGFDALTEQLDAQKRLEQDLVQQLAKAVERVGATPRILSLPLFNDVTYL